MNEFLFDDKLRRALLTATVMDFGWELETANTVSVSFSTKYLRNKTKMLQNPLRYINTFASPLWHKSLRAVAAVVLIIFIAFGSLLLVPEARAAITSFVVEWFTDHVAYRFNGPPSDYLDTNDRYYPAYIPEGFELVNDDYSTGSGFTFYNEHSDISEIMINGVAATLYASNTAGYRSTVIWFYPDEDIAFSLSGDIPVDDLIMIAESVKINK